MNELIVCWYGSLIGCFVDILKLSMGDLMGGLCDYRVSYLASAKSLTISSPDWLVMNCKRKSFNNY